MLKLTKWKRCPHARIVGIYGDEIIHAGWYRLRCLDCGRLLDGPVTLATHSKDFTGQHSPIKGAA